MGETDVHPPWSGDFYKKPQPIGPLFTMALRAPGGMNRFSRVPGPRSVLIFSILHGNDMLAAGREETNPRGRESSCFGPQLSGGILACKLKIGEIKQVGIIFLSQLSRNPWKNYFVAVLLLCKFCFRNR